MLNPRKIQLCGLKGFSFGVFHPRPKPSFFLKELSAYRKLQKEYRMKNIIAYWERQTQIENNFIENYDKQQEKKRLDDLTRFRSSIVKISYDTKRKLEEERKFLDKREANLQKYAMNEELKKMNRKRIVKLLELDSETWFNEATIEKKMVDRVVIPDVVYEKTDYYLRLQEKAVLYEAADYEGLEDLESDKKMIDYKNKQLLPLYSDITSLVKHAKNDETTQLLKEFHYAQAQIFKKYKKGTQAYNSNLKKITEAYVQLLSKYYAEAAKPKNKIDLLHKKLLILYNLLKKWDSYISLVKASSDMMTTMMEMETQEKEKVEEEPEKQELKEGEQQTADEEATSGSEGEVLDLEKEELDVKKEEKMFKEEVAKFREEQKQVKEEEKKKTEEEDPMQKLFSDLFHRIEKNETGKLEQDYDQMFIKDNKAIMYDEEERKDMKDAMEFLKIDKLDQMFPRNFVQEIQNFSVPKLDYQTVAQVKAVEEETEVDEEAEELGKIDQLQTSPLIEIYKKDLEEMRKIPGLTTKEKKKIDELIYLANVIGQFKVDEPNMLLRIWETYSP